MPLKLRLSPNTLLAIAFSICAIFFIAYSVLSVVRHEHYGSFGYDLGINNQVVWRYSHFQLPVITSGPFPGQSKLVTHIESVYALIAPFYWIWSSSRMLLIAEAGFMCISGIPIYLLARKKGLHPLLSFACLLSYLLFYGVQNAMWSDVHSASFAAGFIAWFIYFLDSKKMKSTLVFLVLAITAKENIGILTLLISLVYFIKRREKFSLILIAISAAYLLFAYLAYFPYLAHHTYLYQNKNGLLSDLNPLSLTDTGEKRGVIFYSLASFGFFPLFLPLFLLPALGDLATYFVLASDLAASHGLYLHYRVTLAPLLTWATIMVLNKYKKLNNIYSAMYLIISTLAIVYVLHLPLTYLAKSWFWTEPSGVKNIQSLRSTLKKSDSIVAQNNILPHISQRDQIYTLYPEKKSFSKDSPCGQPQCDWFRWDGNPHYLFVDTSPEWDARHLLIDRDNYVKGLNNIEKAGIVKKYKTSGSAALYVVLKNPNLQAE